ncbi:MAG: hypothetical protein Q9164_007381, partial [Protoblastenia rupestris]
YEFSFSNSVLQKWQIKYTVKGPQKDYVSTSTYRPYPIPRQIRSSEALPDAQKNNDRDKNFRSSKQDAFKTYAWISETEFLATTEQGKIMLGTILAGTDDPQFNTSVPNVTKHTLRHIAWDVLDHQQDLESSSMITSCIALQVAFFTGKSGKTYAYSHKSRRLSTLKVGTRKQGYLKASLVKTSLTDSACTLTLLTRSLGGHAPEIYDILPEEPFRANTSSIPSGLEQENKVEQEFVTTSWCISDHLQTLVEGSRNGELRFHKRDGQARHTVSSVHSGNAVTVILWLFYDGCRNYFITAGRDGKYAIHRQHFGSSDALSFGFKTVHTASPPFGPNIEGAHISSITKDLILWGFSSTRFVVWNETQKSEVVSVECGGAHRNWDYLHNDSTGGGSFVWTKASTCNTYQQARSSHKVLQTGGHGREIKAMAISPSIVYDRGRKIRLIATGAEDTAVRLFKNKDGVFNCLNVMTEHKTGIQRLHWSPNGRWLFSAGGCEEFFAWRVRMLDSIVAVVCEAACPQVTSEKYLRIMDFDVTEISSTNDEMKRSKPDYMIHIAYSDFSIRRWRFHVKAPKGSADNARFTTSLPPTQPNS